MTITPFTGDRFEHGIVNCQPKCILYMYVRVVFFMDVGVQLHAFLGLFQALFQA